MGSLTSTTRLGYAAGVSLQSRQEATNIISNTNIDSIVTSAFDGYLHSFFDYMGSRRKQLAQMVPGVSCFVSDPGMSDSTDPTRQCLSIERLTERLQAKLPCIVIGDTSITLRKTGFGRSLAQSRVSQNVTAHHIGIFREVLVNLLVVANSKSDCYSLSQALHVIFFDAANFLTGSVLRPMDNNATWAIRIPQTIEPGTPSKDQQGGDPKQQVWSNTVGINCFFEDSFIVAGQAPSQPVLDRDATTVAFNFPATGRVGRSVTGTIVGLPFQANVVLDNVNVASLQQLAQSEYTLVFRRPGTVTLRVLDGAATSLKDQGSTVQPNIVAEHTITVTF